MSKHHRRPRSQGGSDAEYNLSFVPQSEHHHWHSFAGNLTPEEICEKINRKFLCTEYMFVCIRRNGDALHPIWQNRTDLPVLSESGEPLVPK